jgi:SAM-dependent methyltransferase/glycosyltransferase involved in cell wall biosynthesis
MKILVDCLPLNVGGGVQVAIALLVNLKMREDIAWQAILPAALKSTLPPNLLSDPRLIFVQKYSTIDRIWLGRRLLALERTFKPDVVFSVFGPAFFRARAPHVVGFALPNLIYGRDGPLVSRNPFLFLADWLRCLSFRRADHLLVETKTVRRRLTHLLKIDPGRISVIGNSLNPVLIQHAGDQPARTDLFCILVPSAYYLHKNLEIVPAVAAAMQRLDGNLAFELQLTLPASSRHWQNIKRVAERLGVADKVITLGTLPLDALAKAYQAAAVVLLPSLREASTAVYPESFLFRRPLVTSDMDFARELCGDAALFVPPLDAEKIAPSLVELIRSPDLRARLTSSGDAQLQRTYPRPEEKFRMQLELLDAVSRDRFFRTASPPKDTAASAEEGTRKELNGQSNVACNNPTVTFHDMVASNWDVKYQSGGFLRRANFFRQEVMPLITGQGDWLDAGCGSGYFARLLGARGMQVTGVDASAPMIAAATKLASESNLSQSLRFEVVPDLVRLPFADNSFAGCLCLSVLEYLDEPYEALDELARVVEPGGLLILSVPSRYSPLRFVQKVLLMGQLNRIAWKLEYKNLSKYATTPSELREALSRRGFELKKIVPFDPVIPPSLVRFVAPSLLFAIGVKSA